MLYEVYGQNIHIIYIYDSDFNYANTVLGAEDKAKAKH